MFAAIKYDNNEIKDFHDFNDVEDYKRILRQEVQQYANGRDYEIAIREKSQTVWHFNSKKVNK